MIRRTYENIDTLVYDPVPTNRNATCASLHSLGFRRVESVGSLDALNEVIEARAPDLLVCEVTDAELEVCKFIQAIRQGATAQNPFVVIIATTWQRDSNVIGQVVNSGADDLLARPVSAKLLGERILAQIEHRKGFVVTSDYIGPDRRRDSARVGAECMEVPNSLKVKSFPGLSEKEAQRRVATAIRQGREIINVERIRRSAFQLCVQWRLLEQRQPASRDFWEILARIREITRDINRRTQGTSQDTAAQWCRSVNDSVRAIGRMSKIANEEADNALIDLGPPMHLLGHAALTLGQMFAPGEIQPANLVELDAIVAKIDLRRAAELKPISAQSADTAEFAGAA